MYDLIGDIHGHADALKDLLNKMGYTRKSGAFRHPDRKALFVGDYIDRGPQIPETLKIVRRMVDAGSAIALMGNHEYNAICFHTEKKGGGHLRSHSIKNFKQHADTLLQFQNKQTEYNDYIAWFKTLPLWYEDDHIRAVHACWNNTNIHRLKQEIKDPYLTPASLVQSSTKGTDLYDLVEETLKGKEVSMPPGQYFYDKDDHKRTDIRIKWWLDPKETNYRELSVIPLDDKLPAAPIEGPSWEFYDVSEKPVFFGHYWLNGEPNLYRGNVCCLDYSVAKGGKLVAYRYDGEATLSNSKFIYV